MRDGWPRHNTMFLNHGVTGVDSAVDRIRSAGGHADDPVETDHGRSASCTDVQGPPFAIHEGDSCGHRRLSYLTFEVTDSARARAFVSATFGSSFRSGSHDDGWQVDELYPMAGLHSRHRQPTVVPMYVVDDIGAIMNGVRAAGGIADDPQRQPCGPVTSCLDDQSIRVYLGKIS
ncbi:hypothetical protein [Pseudonocardia sp. EC080619-01]|uniref:hypothetical protein n=1 Tax=Pseudonocardia sp. EC080619-01 TaxID=1096856 RepID=UPI0011AEBB8C|nr:hypothetical protein [Pseudonocardia sp. EC080619-01]